MACYISSNNNRFYAAVETAFGAVPAITASNRFPGGEAGAQAGRRQAAAQRQDGDAHVSGASAESAQADDVRAAGAT